MSEELESKLDKKIDQLNELQKTTFSHVKGTILALSKGISPDDDQLKPFTTRLPRRNYAELKALSSLLNQSSVSSLGRTILIAGLKDSIDTYLSVNEDMVGDFATLVSEIECDLLGDV